jgi:hypothetical protein
MTDNTDTPQVRRKPTRRERIGRIIQTGWFRQIFLLAMLVYVLLSGYVLYFSGSLFIESLRQGWFSSGASEYDYSSFVLGYLYGFPSLFSLLGGLIVLSTRSRRFFKHKVLLFVPSLLWALTLVLGNFRWGLEYWDQLLFLVPATLLCAFVLFGVAYSADVPYMAPRRKPAAM